MDAPHIRLAALRNHHGLKPKGLGERLLPEKPISDQTIRFIEANKRSAGRDLVVLIEAFSREPNAAGIAWPDGPLLASEWFGHKAHEEDSPVDETAEPAA